MRRGIWILIVGRTERQEPLAASRCKEGAVRGRCASREGREEAQGPNRALLQFTASKFYSSLLACGRAGGKSMQEFKECFERAVAKCVGCKRIDFGYGPITGCVTLRLQTALLVSCRAGPRHRPCPSCAGPRHRFCPCCAWPRNGCHSFYRKLFLLLFFLFQGLHVDDEVEVGKLVGVVPGGVEGGDKDLVLKIGCLKC